MSGRLLRSFALGCLLAASLAAIPAHADTKVALRQSFAGNLNFVGTQVTMRSKSNKENACAVYSSAEKLIGTLSGLPADAIVVSAQLYWAGSNGKAKPDYTVNFDGADVTATVARQYSSATIGSGYDYFGGAADVTTQVAAKRNGDYTFSGLTITNGKPYCKVEGVLGGFSLLVIYSSPSEPLRVLNLYEGFQYFRYSGITINLGNFQVPALLPDNVTARLAHITWEGDPTLQKNGEELLFNNVEVNDSLNPPGNQFNSASNINGAAASYGIDFDAYTIKPSSRTFSAGQTTATTRYQSGQDMVLLNAEIIAMPNSPTADLSITINRNGELQVGRSTNYSLVVRNAGPSVESGPITVTDTLPSGVSFGAASGTGWTCSNAGQLVTCTNPGPLAVGATLPAITLTVRATAAGSYTNTATVTGKMFDNVAANNSASDTSRASPAGANSYVFTSFACPAATRVGGLSCPQFVGPVTAAATQPIYLTAVTFDANGLAIATPLSTTASTILSLRFALSCLDPATGVVSASYAGVALPICSDPANPAWSAAASVTFAQNTPSVAADFFYADVGKVALNVIDAKGQSASTPFVVKPSKLALQSVVRSRDLAPNQASATIGFVKAGEPFTLAVGALGADGSWAPSFGNEMAKTIGGLIKLVQPDGTEIPDFDDGDPTGNGFTSTSNGAVTGNQFKWNRTGLLTLVPVLADYLGTGAVAGLAKDIGRFYPDHFETGANANFDCLKNMACPAGINGAVYSAQPFRVSVTAHGLNGPTDGFEGVISLQAYDRPGGAVQNPGGAVASPLSPASFNATKAADAKVGDTIPVDLAYKLALAYNSTVQPPPAWTKPTPIYLRVSAVLDVVQDKDGKLIKPETITSKDAALADPTAEGGVMVVNGRLQLANAFGSELLKLPVPINAQYWTGTRWESNTADGSSTIDGSKILFTDCQKALASNGGCNPVLKTVGPPVVLADGAGKLWLAAPGPGNVGSAWLQWVDVLVPWLPGTRARVVYGIYKSPLIYVREVY
ncbi:MAG: DUF6701 domain-containing protein [Massilia sp.]